MADTPNINDVMNQIQSYIDNYDDFEQNGPKDSDQHQPTIGELDQFRKDWFYDDWQIRFRELNAFYPLGTKGVVAIPNTTFEEWLYWFQQWAIAFEQDYNKFKKLMFDTISLIEKHLEAIDKTLEDHEKRIQKLEQEVQDIYNKIQDIYNKIGDINNQINGIKNQITNLGDEITNLGDEINNLRDQIHNDIAPHWLPVTGQAEGALNGWYLDSANIPKAFNIGYRWLNQSDHSQGLYISINLNHVINDTYSPGDKDTLMRVDLTKFVNETHVNIPSEGWPAVSGSYYTSHQRAGYGLHYVYDSNTHMMTVDINHRDGVYSADTWPDKITLISNSEPIYCTVS